MNEKEVRKRNTKVKRNYECRLKINDWFKSQKRWNDLKRFKTGIIDIEKEE